MSISGVSGSLQSLSVLNTIQQDSKANTKPSQVPNDWNNAAEYDFYTNSDAIRTDLSKQYAVSTGDTSTTDSALYAGYALAQTQTITANPEAMMILEDAINSIPTTGTSSDASTSTPEMFTAGSTRQMMNVVSGMAQSLIALGYTPSNAAVEANAIGVAGANGLFDQADGAAQGNGAAATSNADLLSLEQTTLQIGTTVANSENAVLQKTGSITSSLAYSVYAALSSGSSASSVEQMLASLSSASGTGSTNNGSSPDSSKSTVDGVSGTSVKVAA